MGKMRQNINIEPVLFNVAQVQAYLGGNIGKNAVIELMKRNVIPTVTAGAKRQLLTRKQDVDEFIDYMFKHPIKQGGLDTYPLKLIAEFGKEKSLTSNTVRKA
jgi:hypothetical protein